MQKRCGKLFARRWFNTRSIQKPIPQFSRLYSLNIASPNAFIDLREGRLFFKFNEIKRRRNASFWQKFELFSVSKALTLTLWQLGIPQVSFGQDCSSQISLSQVSAHEERPTQIRITQICTAQAGFSKIRRQGVLSGFQA
jgi:hypothetical protein